MDAYPLFFLLLFAAGVCLAMARGPIWGLILYLFVYFNIPSQQWWGHQVPELRWSLVTVGALLVSCFLHPAQIGGRAGGGGRPLKVLVLLLLLMAALAPLAYDPALAWNRSYDFFRYVLMFYLVGKIISDFQKYQAFVTGLMLCSFYLFWLADHYFHGQRLDGVGLPDASDANMLAAFILLVLPLMAALFLTGSTWQKAAVLLGLPFALNTFVMCSSRGAFIGLLVQMAVGLGLLRNNPYRKGMLAVAAVMAITLWGLMDQKYQSRLLGLESSVSTGDAAESSSGRIDIWKAGLDIVSDYPLGAGGGAFMTLSPQYLPRHLIEKEVGQRASHNTYLQMLVEAGPLGLVCYLLFLVALFLEVLSALRRQRGRPEDAAGKMVVCHGNALIVALCGFFAASFFIDRVYFEGIYLVAALAPVLGVLCCGQEQAAEVAAPHRAVPA